MNANGRKWNALLMRLTGSIRSLAHQAPPGLGSLISREFAFIRG
jgi:hypothetical protein